MQHSERHRHRRHGAAERRHESRHKEGPEIALAQLRNGDVQTQRLDGIVPRVAQRAAGPSKARSSM